jgi:hypothetical protein
LEETTNPENPRVLSPQARSPVTILAKQKIPITLGETGVPSILFYLISIYDDEESSEVSLINLVLITKEK